MFHGSVTFLNEFFLKVSVQMQQLNTKLFVRTLFLKFPVVIFVAAHLRNLWSDNPEGTFQTLKEIDKLHVQHTIYFALNVQRTFWVNGL